MRRLALFSLYALLCALLVAASSLDWINAYLQLVLMYIGINIILTASLNLINGYMGEFSVGHAGFMAVGAYVTSVLNVFLFTADKGSEAVLAPSSAIYLFPVTVLLGGVAAALAGLAPHPNESGKKIGYRRMRGGRPAVRTVLFMPAMQAACGRGEFAAFYKRLVAAGKKPILALAAVMRKIVVTLNARLRDAQLQQS